MQLPMIKDLGVDGEDGDREEGMQGTNRWRDGSELELGTPFDF